MITIRQYLFQLGRHPAVTCGNSLYYHCPLHDDSTPSLRVTAGTPYRKGEELWNCFGCGVGGILPNLIRLLENVSWKKAYELAGETTWPPAQTIEQEPQPKRKSCERASLLQQQILSFFTLWWHDQIFENKAVHARIYTNMRGVANATMEETVIGYAPWDGDGRLVRAMLPQICDRFGWLGIAEAEKMGLLITDMQSRELRFLLQNRVMFSCLDPASGSTLYYQGRVVEPSKAKRKIIGPTGIAKASFWMKRQSSDFSLITESPFGPACLDRYDITGFATLGQGFDPAYLTLFSAPFFLAHDNDVEQKEGGRAGEKQAAKCMEICVAKDIPAHRLLPPQFSEKKNGVDDWLVRGGYSQMMRQIDNIRQKNPCAA